MTLAPEEASSGEGQERRNLPVSPMEKQQDAITLHNTQQCQVFTKENDELQINATAGYEYHESSVTVFTETWLHRDVPDSLCDLEGFSLICFDRSQVMGKDKGSCIFFYQ